MSTEVSAPDVSEPPDSPDGARPDGDQAPAAESPRYLSRDLSWLEFNARVLSLAADDESVPLLERAKFLAIFSQNLDEFFQIRVAGIKDQVVAGVGAGSSDGLTPQEELDRIRARVEELAETEDRSFLDELVPALAENGIRLSDWESLDEDDREDLVKVFHEQIFPVLTPLSVDPGHPFPYISNLSLNLAVMVRDPKSGERRFARVKIPPVLPRFVVMPDGERFVPLEQVIAAHLDSLFPGMVVESHHPFRVIRNADLSLEEDEADDLLAALETELQRRRFGKAVRLEIHPTMSDDVRGLLVDELEVAEDDVYILRAPLDLSGLWAVHDLDRPDLKDEVWNPVTQPRLARAEDGTVDFFAVLRDGDVLVHHPYESFATSVEAFVKQAAADPQVLAIKQTLYRTSGDSPIIKALIRASERGKQVAVLVELKARFDEQANIAWARALEEAGVHVVYGLLGLKTHCKTALVVRQEDDGIRRYCHVGTGNYNPKTARIYEDLGLLSADPELGADLTNMFNFLTGYSRRMTYHKLLMAPGELRDRMLELIAGETEAGSQGRIVMKMNSLVDKAVIDALYEASSAGVPVDLIVRGICCLDPGVPGLSENIRVRSIVGRYLEHSRIFAFGTGEHRPVRYFIGSADAMPRNFDLRVEAVTPVESEDLCERLQEILDLALEDDLHSWELSPNCSWKRVRTSKGVGLHETLRARALERANTQAGS
ncbi:MAG TPA: RNA degradosome polyphosphate kinase [Acidimicrobiales bacterium]|nr:RNA degradosome polyphosphate kinase [Acidimicrobiales bacterium]